MLKKVIYGLIFIALQDNYSLAQPITLNGTALTSDAVGTCGTCLPGEYRRGGSASISGACATLTPGSSQQGNVFSCSSINLNQSFDLSFTANFGSYTDPTIGDGITFTLKDSVTGCGVGGSGGNMGYTSGPTGPGPSVWGNILTTEFDTNDAAASADNDVPCDNVAIQANGNMTPTGTVAGPACANCGAPSGTEDSYLSNGANHTIRITWDPATDMYTVYVDGEKVISMNVDITTYFASPSAVSFGFTAGNAAGGTAQSVCNAVMTTGGVIPAPCGGACCTLPVDLLYFNIEEINNVVLLSWSTASEKNNNYFEVFRSSDAKNWISLGKIEGAGNSSTNKYYELSDNSANFGINYYKLKQVDFDGKSDEFLRVINTENGNKEFSFQAYPIPATNELNITLDYSLTFDESKIEVQLYNPLGQLVYSRKNLSEHLISINTEEYTKGLYQLVIKANDKIQNQKIIIQ